MDKDGMENADLLEEALNKYAGWYGDKPSAIGYAPGRIEVLGNHTDYNEGYVLSAAINFGTFFLAATNQDGCRLVAGDLMEEQQFAIHQKNPIPNTIWPNYVVGVASQLASEYNLTSGFKGLFFGNVPLGAGLSSSAALEMTTGMALSSLYSLELKKIELAKVGQRAEHQYVGAKTGLLDQISSLFGVKNQLVRTDFRSLDIDHLSLPVGIGFLVCDTGTKHSLGDSDYNTRREACERAAVYFAKVLKKKISALRDVSESDWKLHADKMETESARRSAHVIGENARVLKAAPLLKRGNVEEFGALMFQSHESSIHYFENSCPELDVIVAAARQHKKVFGARLSGGGFGGSAVLLIEKRHAEEISADLSIRYNRIFPKAFIPRFIEASDGACVIPPSGKARSE